MHPFAKTPDIKPQEKADTPVRKFCAIVFPEDLKGDGAFPWRPTLKDKIQRWLMSQKLQLAAQVAVAQIWASSFTFVRHVSHLLKDSLLVPIRQLKPRADLVSHSALLKASRNHLLRHQCE